MRPEHVEVKRWLLKARHDRTAIEKIFTPDCQELDVAAFHCQQAIEKTLKAYLVFCSIPFEKVHDLGRLLDHCSRADPGFESLRDDVEPLTLYATTYRYPGPADPTREQVEHALTIVEAVWSFVREHLPESLTS